MLFLITHQVSSAVTVANTMATTRRPFTRDPTWARAFSALFSHVNGVSAVVDDMGVIRQLTVRAPKVMTRERKNPRCGGVKSGGCTGPGFVLFTNLTIQGKDCADRLPGIWRPCIVIIAMDLISRLEPVRVDSVEWLRRFRDRYGYYAQDYLYWRTLIFLR